MASKLEKIHKLEEQVKVLKEKLTYYGKEFIADGHIDSEEQAHLDRMNSMIANIETNIKERLEKLGFFAKMKHKAANAVENIADAAHHLKDSITGQDHDDHIDKTLPELEEKDTDKAPATPVENENTTPENTEAPKEEEPAAVPTDSIQKSVGEGGVNQLEDVKVIQTLLNDNGASLVVDGIKGKNTYKAIRTFQSKVGIPPDGLISPSRGTFKALLAGKKVEEPAKEETAPTNDTSSSDSAEDSTDTTTEETSTDDTDKKEEPSLATTSKINASVGKGGKNKPEDVVLVKTLLNKYGHKFALEPQEEAVKADAALTEAIKKFQIDYRGSTRPDGRIDANGATWGSLLGVARIKGDLLKVAKEYGVEPAVILAIQAVESGGNGFFSDGRPKILFEGHIFWKELKKAGKDPAALQKGNENIIYPKWVKTHYAGGIKEYDRLEKALKIDKIAALKSASWGEFQIMGFNHSVVGYGDVESFVDAMHEAGSNQLGGLMGFLKNNNLIKHVSGAKKNWAALARGYNGPAYAQNKYDVQLEKAYNRFSKLSL
jgi:peptidoglycan hydrolase-like protein with peptidoglycan-binding domain